MSKLCKYLNSEISVFIKTGKKSKIEYSTTCLKSNTSDVVEVYSGVCQHTKMSLLGMVSGETDQNFN